jgi:hypothetical protein
VTDVPANSILGTPGEGAGPWATTLFAKAEALLVDCPRIDDLGELAFTADWSLERRRVFVDDLRDVSVYTAASRDDAVLRAFIDASRPRAAAGPGDPARTAAMRAETDDLRS